MYMAHKANEAHHKGLVVRSMDVLAEELKINMVYKTNNGYCTPTENPQATPTQEPSTTVNGIITPQSSTEKDHITLCT
jgi:hypothetical protein